LPEINGDNTITVGAEIMLNARTMATDVRSNATQRIHVDKPTKTPAISL
jgi:hypothetical protein